MEGEQLRILLIGSGGREHALAWKLSQSPRVDFIKVVPGNGGTAAGLPKVQNLSVDDPDDFSGLLKVAKENDVNLVIPGPENPLVAGIGDVIRRGVDPVPVFSMLVLIILQLVCDVLDLPRLQRAWRGVRLLRKISWHGITSLPHATRISTIIRAQETILIMYHTMLLLKLRVVSKSLGLPFLPRGLVLDFHPVRAILKPKTTQWRPGRESSYRLRKKKRMRL